MAEEIHIQGQNGPLADVTAARALKVDASATVQPIRVDTPIETIVTDGTDTMDVIPLAGSNAAAVAIVDGAGNQITSFGGGTQYTEGDIDASITGTATLWEDAGNTLTPVSSTKPLPVNIVAGSSAGTEYTEGDVDATIAGSAVMMEVAGNTLQPIQGTVADGLLVNLGSNNDVTVTGSVAVTGPLTDVQLRATPVPISGTVTATPTGTQNVDITANTIGLATEVTLASVDTSLNTIESAILAEDSPHVSGDRGIMALAVRNDTNATLGGTDGDYTPIAVNGKGAVGIHDAGNTITVDGTVAISGTVPISAASLPLATGAATAALQTQPGVDIGDVTINNAAGASAVNIQDGGNSITIDAASLPLPTGAATQATLATVDTNIATLAGTVTGGQVYVRVISAPALAAGTANIGDVDIASIAAGSSIIGKVGIDQTTPGTTNGVQVNAALPAGTSYIGKTRPTDGITDAEIVPLAGYNAQAVAIVDGTGAQITSFGGGTQYTEGDVDASITGTALMWEDAADTLRVASAAKPLPTTVISNPAEGVVSTVNSSTATLGVGAAFTGTSEDITNYSSVTVNVISNVASATDGLSMQQSSDGANWDITDVYTIPAATGKTFGVQCAARYFRVVYTNGGTIQGSFRLHTVYHKYGQRTSSIRPQDARSNENDFNESMAYLSGYNGTTWDRLRSTTKHGLVTDTHNNAGTLFRGASASFRTLGRAGTVGQKILAIHNATGSAQTVRVNKITVDMWATVVKAVTVAPPIVRIWKFTAVPTNGTNITKNKVGGTTTSNASITLWNDSSADGTGSATTLTVTLPAGTFIDQQVTPRLITAAGENSKASMIFDYPKGIELAPLEGLCVFLDYTLATQNPVTDMWTASVLWEEFTT